MLTTDDKIEVRLISREEVLAVSSETNRLVRGLDERMKTVETEIGGLSTRVGNIETRVGHIETLLVAMAARQGIGPDGQPITEGD
jgi:hypothetical protein